MDTTVEHRSRRNSNKTARGHRSISNRRRLQFDTLEDRRLLAVAAFNPLAPDGGSIALHFDDTQEIATSNEEDEFTFTVEGGQTLSVIVDGLDPMDNLQPRIELQDPAQETVMTAEGGANEIVFFQTAPLASTGEYKVIVTGQNGSTGSYDLNLVLNALVERVDTDEGNELLVNSSELSLGDGLRQWAALGQTDDANGDRDEFELDLTGLEGHTLDIILASPFDEDLTQESLQLLDVDTRLDVADQTVLATGTSTPLGVTATNYELAILDFVVPRNAGRYTIVVDSDVETLYTLVVTDQAMFHTEPNDATATLRSFDRESAAVGALDASGDSEDHYTIDLTVGEALELSTDTLWDTATTTPLDDLDPAIQVLDGAGNVVASDTDSGPGDNAALRFEPTADGTYKIRVHAESGSGQYVLSAETIKMLDFFALGPAGSQGFVAVAENQELTAVGDAQKFEIFLEAGENLSAIVDFVDRNLAPKLEIFDGNQQLVFSGTSSQSDALLAGPIAITASDTYTLRVSGVGDTFGAFELNLFRNAALDRFDSDDGRELAIDASATNVGPNAQRLEVIGRANTLSLLGQWDDFDEHLAEPIGSGSGRIVALDPADDPANPPANDGQMTLITTEFPHSLREGDIVTVAGTFAVGVFVEEDGTFIEFPITLDHADIVDPETQFVVDVPHVEPNAPEPKWQEVYQRPIDSFVDLSGTTKVNIVGKHELKNGDQVIIVSGKAGYRGQHTISNATSTSFEIPVGFEGSDSSARWFAVGDPTNNSVILPGVEDVHGFTFADLWAAELQIAGQQKTLAFLGHVGAHSGVDIVDITDPTAPARLSTFRHLSPGEDLSSFAAGSQSGFTKVTAVDDHLLSNGDVIEITGTTQYDGKFTIQAVTDDTFEIPVAFGTNEANTGDWHRIDANSLRDLKVDPVEKVAYFASNNGAGVLVVDISDPSDPTEIAQIDRTTFSDGGGREGIDKAHNAAHNIWLEDQVLYVVDNRTPDIHAYDVSTPSSPVYLTTITVSKSSPGNVHDVRVFDDVLYASVLLESDNAAPNGFTGFTEIHEVSDIGNGNTVAIAVFETGFFSHSSWPFTQVDPGTQEDRTFLAVSQEGFASDEFGFSFDTVGKLTIYDITPAMDAIANLGSVPDPDEVAIGGQITKQATLENEDINQPTSGPHHQVVVGDLLYVSWFEAGVQIFDISDVVTQTDPDAAPPLVASYDTSIGAPAGSRGNFGIFPQLGNDLVLASDFATGLHALEFGADVDEFTIDLSDKAGHSIDIVFSGILGADLSTGQTLELLDTDGTTVLRTGTASPLGTAATNYDLAILDFVVPQSPGVYTIRATFDVEEDQLYSIVVTDQAAFDTEPNGSGDTLRSLDGLDGALGELTASTDVDDRYELTLVVGDIVSLETLTPFDGASSNPSNALDPKIELRDSGGNLVASDTNSAADGKNAKLTYTAVTAGVFEVHVISESGSGSYELLSNVAPTAAIAGPATGVRGQPRSFTLTATDDSVVDQAGDFTFEIDFDGDDVVDQTTTGPSGTVVEHIYTSSGSNTVKVTATDSQGLKGKIATHSITIVDYELQTDPDNPTLSNFVFGGTTGNDTATFTQNTSTSIDVSITQLDGVSVSIAFTQTGLTGKLIAYAQPGDDSFNGAGLTNTAAVMHGDTGNDSLVAGAGHDLLDGGAGDDTLVGNAGFDLLTGGTGDDSLEGGTGLDTYTFARIDDTEDLGTDSIAEVGSPSIFGDGLDFTGYQRGISVNLASTTPVNDTGRLVVNVNADDEIDIVFGTQFDDVLIGNDVDNLLRGVAGDDTLFGGIGDDVLEGGSGDDTFGFDRGDVDTVDLGDDTIVESNTSNDAADLILFSSFDAGVQSVDVDLSASDGVVLDIPNKLKIKVQPLPFGAGNAEGMEGVIGTDLGDTLTGNNRDNFLIGGAGADSLDGGAGNDFLVGEDDNDTLAGGAGDDFLVGGEGDDLLEGNLGNDNYIFERESDAVDLGHDTIIESTTTNNDALDAVVFSDFDANVQALSVDLSASDGVIVDIANKLKITAKPSVMSSGDASGIEAVGGTALADTITGNDRPNVLYGDAGNDTLTGGSGRDILIGALGADSLSGGADDDILLAGDIDFGEEDNAALVALAAIQAEWTSSRDYETRVANIKGTGTGPRDNGDHFFDAATLVDDAAVDTLVGGAGIDWFIHNLFEDIASDLETSEEETNVG